MASARPQRYDSSSIRRKEETEELLVFGYSCKLFRDDEKALYIDQGKHLIPWMGDETLKIDRYDVRGTVYDLRSLEPLGGGASDALWSTLSDAERKVEQLCDEERYRALYHNEAEEAMYQEEELKRLHKALDPQNSYGQVAYSYDNEADQDATTASSIKEASETAEEDDEPFIPPQELDIPVGMVLPERTKLNAIIEKTAAFINTQGPQMEIILKMKQANNPQFSFLSFDCPLHAYYRHLLMAIKTGRYRTRQEREQQEQNDLESSDHYLHPSLATATKPVELAPSIPSISYKPSADCAYSMLVNKIKDRHGKLSDDNSSPSSPGDVMGREDNTSDNVIPPPADIQVIIDKMASYVIKNGRDFESVVRSKGDERFAFLEAGHKFHPYYEHKVRVYQGLEPPRNFSQAPSATGSTNSSSQKQIQNTGKKKQSPEKKRPILLPGYEYSDDSSESEDDESDDSKVELKGKPKLAPVCFSIKKPKEAEILKEVKSALPVEEESSEEEGDGNGDGEAASKPSNSISDSNPVDCVQDEGDHPTITNPEEEMRRLQQMLKEKEKQLREQERQRKLSDKRSQDIFQIEATEKPSLPHLPQSTSPPPPPPPPLPPPLPPSTVEATVENGPEGPTNNHQDCVETLICVETNTTVINDSTSIEKKDEAEVKVEASKADDLLNEISETEIIDLTEEADDAPKVTDTMRLERKRKAAAFLSRLQKQRHISKNGGSHPPSDSDAASRHSTPSPTLLKREKVEAGIANFHEAGIPRTSLMARLAASTQMPRHQTSEKKKVPKEKSNFHRKSEKSESPMKSKDREERSHRRPKGKRKKESSPPSESENERSRSRSRSMSYSRSPSHKRRQGDDSDCEQRSHRHHKEGKSGRRKKHDASESTDAPRDHSRHHRRHEEERRSHNHSYNSEHVRGRNHVQGHSHSRNLTKKTDTHGSESDSSD